MNEGEDEKVKDGVTLSQGPDNMRLLPLAIELVGQ